MHLFVALIDLVFGFPIMPRMFRFFLLKNSSKDRDYYSNLGRRTSRVKKGRVGLAGNEKCS